MSKAPDDPMLVASTVGSPVATREISVGPRRSVIVATIVLTLLGLVSVAFAAAVGPDSELRPIMYVVAVILSSMAFTLKRTMLAARRRQIAGMKSDPGVPKSVIAGVLAFHVGAAAVFITMGTGRSLGVSIENLEGSSLAVVVILLALPLPLLFVMHNVMKRVFDA
jgi:hypothetical protein